MIKSYPSTFIYFLVISLSIIIIMSSNNWFFTWMGFELSLFGFMPLFSMTTKTTESVMKYFLMQTSGSAMFMTSFLTTNVLSPNFISLGMMMKMGLFPFIQWMPIVMSTMTWSGCAILATLQKVGPFMVIMLMDSNTLLILLSATSIFLASVMGFNQTMLRPLMAYSSISHSGWMILLAPMSMKLFLIYMSIYFTTTILLFNSFKKTNSEKINQSSKGQKDTLTQNICLLALAGIPPFAIFILKLNILFFYLAAPILVAVLLISTYITSYYYLSFIIPKMVNQWTKITTSPSLALILNLTPSLLIL